MTALPEILRVRTQQTLDSLSPDFTESVAARPQVAETLELVFTSSDYIAQACQRHPASMQALVESGDLTRTYRDGSYARTLAQRLEPVVDEGGLHRELRLFRRREMVRIAWRDIAGWAQLNETLRDLSDLADACVDRTLARLYAWQTRDFGTPSNAAGEPQQLVVLGMGKLGAHELNYSSDIDLIYCFPEHGETQGGPRSVANEEFFTRLGQRLTQALNNQTADGFVFRVDLRLRPFGDSGPPVMSFDGMEAYYTTHGREWERYAMVKARVIAGDQVAGAELMAMLRPFVYRRYLDYGAYENLREMKEMIAREVRRKEMEDNVKLGPGGIREVEFIGQAFQLIRGGQDPALQERRILRVLSVLEERDLLPGYVVEELVRCYIFLRNVEHRLQEWRDEQTQMLPEDAEGQARLAYSLGYADWAGLRKELARVMRRVHEHFLQVFEAPQAAQGEAEDKEVLALWHGQLEAGQAAAVLARLGYSEPEAAAELIRHLRDGRVYLNLSVSGRGRLDRLMPMLLAAIGLSEQPMVTLGRVLGLLEQVARRTAYLALLIENPMALSQLVRLCGVSPWITRQLSQYPILLDELLDPRTLYNPPSREDLEADLRRRLAKVDPEDLETQMEVLRHFRHAGVLRVAAADIAEALPLMVVSDYLTAIAEVVVEEVLDRAWWHLVARHGRPICSREGEVCEQSFAVVAYGKLGGIELGYGSDLDLVFVHDSETEELPTSGERPIPSAVFFARLAQRIIHMLTAQTPSGVLYEVDTRLRPSGASGLMVSSLAAFSHYQLEQAWTWEHQALVRARVVAGDPGIKRQFDTIRHEVLTRRRDLATLRREVVEMREKMRASLDSGGVGLFDVKQGIGGIVDIEFIVQFGVLAWSCDYPQLTRYTDNMRILDGLAETGCMGVEEVERLQRAYKALRKVVHHLKLREEKACVAEDLLGEYRGWVVQSWRRVVLQVDG